MNLLTNIASNQPGGIGKAAYTEVAHPGPPPIDPAQSFGADPTGLTDATAAFQNAYAAAVAAGHNTLRPSPGTYTLSGPIHGSDPISTTLKIIAEPGSVIIQRGSASNPAIAINSCLVESIGSKSPTVALSADAAAGATSLTVASLPGSGLNPEDWIEIASNVVLSGNAVTAEVVQVASVTGSGPYTIGLYGPLEESYAVANSATICSISLASVGSVIRGVTFRQTAQNRDSAAFPFVRFGFAGSIRIEDCVFRDGDTPGIELRGVISADVVNCHFENLTDNVSANFIGYGTNVAGNCRDIRLDGPRGRRVRHVVTTTWGSGWGPGAAFSDVGCPRHVTVSHGQGWETSSGPWNTHQEGKYITFADCESHNDNNAGFYMRCPFAQIINPTAVNPSASHPGIVFATDTTSLATDGLVIGGRVILGPNTIYGILIQGARCTVIGTTIIGPGASGDNVYVSASDSLLIGIRSLNPNGSGHIGYSSTAGTGHVIDGGVFNSSGGKQLINGAAGLALRISGGPSGTNLTKLGVSSGGAIISESPPAVAAKAANYSIGDLDRLITEDATGAARTVTLPDVTTIGVGREFIIKKIDSSANTVTVATTSAQTIDGSTTQVISAQWGVVRVVSNGTSWVTW